MRQLRPQRRNICMPVWQDVSLCDVDVYVEEYLCRLLRPTYHSAIICVDKGIHGKKFFALLCVDIRLKAWASGVGETHNAHSERETERGESRNAVEERGF